jgi:ankyrin repeat protein
MKIDKRLYIEKNQKELNADLVQACKDGDLDLVQFLLNDKELPLKAQLYYIADNMEYSNSLLISCANGHLNIVKYLCTSEDLSDRRRSDNKVEAALSTAAAYGYLDIVRFFMEDGRIDYLDIHKNPNAFISACGSGELEIVKYFMSSPYIKVHTDPEKYVLGFKKACANNYVNIAQYFLEDTDLLQSLVTENYKEIFSNACTCSCINILDYLLKNTYINEHVNMESHFLKAVEHNNLEVVHYFIFEHGIKKTEKIEQHIKDNKEIQTLFNTRELKNELSNELGSFKDEVKSKRLKL